jgi:hypothetical protein
VKQNKENEMFHLRNIGGMTNFVAYSYDISGNGRAGGRACFWNNSVTIDIYDKSPNFLHMTVTSNTDDDRWRDNGFLWLF